MSAITCPSCRQRSLTELGSSGARVCLRCGQKFFPARFSLAQVEEMTRRVQAAQASEEKYAKDRFENHLDLKLWVPKTYH